MSDERADVTVKEYASDEIVVEWEPSLCIHSANCISRLPAVFNLVKRPWVNVYGATLHEIEQAVAACPSGALRTRQP